MKALHHPNLFAWSCFNAERNIDFNSYFWLNGQGNLLVDPLELSSHDRAHLEELGGAKWIVVTNSDHIRCSAALARQLGAALAGPAAEKDTFGLTCQRWLNEGDELVDGLEVIEMHGSKTAGELALLVQGNSLITGDLVRCHQAGSLTILPPNKLSDPALAKASVERLAERSSIEAVLVGDGWPIFDSGSKRLRELALSL